VQKREQLTAVERAELEEASNTLRRGEAVRIVVGQRVVLCSSLDEVRAAQLGRIPHDAVRLDGRQTRT
jgi:hypothetical protein